MLSISHRRASEQRRQELAVYSESADSSEEVAGMGATYLEVRDGEKVAKRRLSAIDERVEAVFFALVTRSPTQQQHHHHQQQHHHHHQQQQQEQQQQHQQQEQQQQHHHHQQQQQHHHHQH
ncbi:unnamed protein product [Lampetra fluviatilis]